MDKDDLMDEWEDREETTPADKMADKTSMEGDHTFIFILPSALSSNINNDFTRSRICNQARYVSEK